MMSQQKTLIQSHTGMYVTAIGLLIPAGLGLFCCYFFWYWPARLVHRPLQPGNMQYTIVDDDRQHPSTDVMAIFYQLQDLVKIMACYRVFTYMDGESM